MKKQILSLSAFIALSAFSTQSFGQDFVASGSNLVTNAATTGNVGIKTFGTPTQPLTVNGDIGYESSVLNRHLYGNTNQLLAIFASSSWSDGGGILLNSRNFDPLNPKTGGIALVAPPAITGTPQNEIAFDFVQANAGGTFGPSYMNINKIGHVGINTNANDADHLTVNGNIGFATKSDYSYINGRSTHGITIFSNEDANNGSYMMLNSQTNNGDIRFVANDNSAGPTAFSFATRNIGGYEIERVHIEKDGQVVIGDVPMVPWSNGAPTYKLYVETGILTEKVKVALSSDPTNWSDFVFDDDYELRDLSEVEDYIKKNKHLPEIPSTAEVHKEGLDLAQMDAKLLQKIEELTLYVIQQQKEIELLKKKTN